MGKRLKKYLEYISNRINEPMTDDEREKLKEDLLVQISFFQHERLIHLIVTVLFAVLTVSTFFVIIFTAFYLLWILFLLLIALLVPYIVHYFKLENGVQKLYEFYDELIKCAD